MFNKFVYVMFGFWILFGIACIVGGDLPFGAFALLCGVSAIAAIRGWL